MKNWVIFLFGMAVILFVSLVLIHDPSFPASLTHGDQVEDFQLRPIDD